MSSHHVVREKQEPALIIANGASCSWETLGQMLEWSPYVMVLDGAVSRVLEMGIHFDAVLGDMDSVKGLDELKAARPELEILHRPNQDKTDLQKAMDELVAREFPAVNIAWATGRRMDHTLNNIVSLAAYAGRIDWRLVDDYGLAYVMPREFKKQFVVGSAISLFGIPSAGGIVSKNLKYELDNTCLALPGSGSSNEPFENGLVEISYKEGCLVLMECWDL
jgi:thiamine pyrophosphokinase